MALAATAPAHAAPGELLPVGDPIESELRILDVLGPADLNGRILLPGLGTRPLRWLDLEGTGAIPDHLERAREIARIRIERALGRQATGSFVPDSAHRSTAWTLRVAGDEGGLGELSLGAEGSGTTTPGNSSFASGSGVQARVGVSLENWIGYSHILIGQVDRGHVFADPIIRNSDVLALSEDTYLGYTSTSRRWAAWLGRSRWNWGPGEEATLTLSKTSPAYTGFAYRVGLPWLHVVASALSATLDESTGRQLAAHRVEWQPVDALRLGVTETATYHGTGWRPLYLVGAIPYIFVQRMEWQDNPDSLRGLRNNVMVSFDGAWRLAPGTRVYAELLVDDLHSSKETIPNKYGYQLGWEGAGTIDRTRVTWGGEYTRITRYVYTSFFGQSYEAQGRPIGFPTGPDSRRVRLRGSWDLNEDWQLNAVVTRTDQGQNTIDQPFVPGLGGPVPNSATFEGIVEHTRTAEAGIRWWPASGVDLAVAGGWQWVENRDHVTGASADGAIATAAVRLTR